MQDISELELDAESELASGVRKAPQELSVFEISSKIRFLLENNFAYVRVKGEISGLKIATSGHAYFNLKDQEAVIAATCWRHQLAHVRFRLEDGISVVVTGKITAYAGQSKYQISVEQIEPEGVGNFLRILQERKEKLLKEGLFDEARKRSLPRLPRSIGVITSLGGAVIKDILHRISERCPVKVVIWSVAVQGETSASEVTAAIQGFNDLPEERRPDVLIVARGGGSIEDLWSFNEESVVRAAATSKIPIISAVGHETDYTLLDFAADVRAPTPTAAAEFATPVLADLQATVRSKCRFIYSKLDEKIKFSDRLLQGIQRLTNYPSTYFASKVQKIDELILRLEETVPNLLKRRKDYLSHFVTERMVPRKILEYKALEFEALRKEIGSAGNRLLDNYTNTLNLNSNLLASMDYSKVLKRGFAIVQNNKGNYITSRQEAALSNNLSIRFHDGIIDNLKR